MLTASRARARIPADIGVAGEFGLGTRAYIIVASIFYSDRFVAIGHRMASRASGCERRGGGSERRSLVILQRCWLQSVADNIVVVPGLADELWHLIRNSKKWWLLPIIFVMVVLGALMLFSATAAAPFIYTLF